MRYYTGYEFFVAVYQENKPGEGSKSNSLFKHLWNIKRNTNMVASMSDWCRLLTLWCKVRSIDRSLLVCWLQISNGAILSNRIDCRHEFKSKMNLSFYLGVIRGRLVIWGEAEGIKEAASHPNLSCSEADLRATSPTTPFPSFSASYSRTRSMSWRIEEGKLAGGYLSTDKRLLVLLVSWEVSPSTFFSRRTSKEKSTDGHLLHSETTEPLLLIFPLE